MPTKTKNPIYYIFTFIIVALLLGLGISLKLYFDTQKKIQDIQQSSGVTNVPSTEEIKALVNKIGQHFLLPAEEPKLITISNADAFRKTQPFFQKAQNGDKLLIYSQKVILYNPSSDKIIDVAQIKPPDNTSTTPTISAIPSLSPTITIKL